MSREDNTYAMIAFVSGIMVTVAAMILAIFIAVQRPVVVVVGSAQPAGGSPSAAPATQPAGAAVAAVSTPGEISAARVPAVPALANIYDPAWDRVPAVDLPLQPQAIAMPTLDTPTIPSVTVQSLHDSTHIAFRLSWPAAQPSANVDVDRFTDAVAVQFAPDPTTPFMMGAAGKPVRILHWKALWQKDLDEGFQDVQKLHPNFWVDSYWFAEGKFPFPMTDSFKDPVSQQWLIAHSAGNPMANYQRKQPVEELVAEGFGSATHLANSSASARGSWKNGRWTVVIDRPYTPNDPLSSSVQPGQTGVIAFAVWDGSAANVGGRKHYCTWVPLKVQP